MRPRVEEDEAPEPLYAVFTVTWPLGHQDDAYTLELEAVLLVKEAHKPYIIPDWSRYGASVGLAGENMLLDDACALAALIQMDWEKE